MSLKITKVRFDKYDIFGEIESEKGFICGGCIYNVHILDKDGKRTGDKIHMKGSNLKFITQ
jgi:hypothetical protein